MAAASEMATSMARCDSPGSLIVGQKAAPCGVRSPARAVFHTYASAIGKPTFNWGVGRGWGRVERPSERGGDEEAIVINTGVYGGHRPVERVRELRYMEIKKRMTTQFFRPVKQDRRDASYPAVGETGEYCLETGWWWWRHGLLKEERS